MIDKRLFFIIALFGGLQISSAAAFVSYGEEKDKPNPNPVTKTADNVSESEIQKNKDLEDLYKGRTSPVSSAPIKICTAGFIQVGKSSKLSSKKYHGSASSLEMAAEEIAPSGWKVIAKGAPLGFVEWNMKGTWAQALGNAANSVDACIGIEWKTKHIVIKTKEAVAPKTNRRNESQAGLDVEKMPQVVDAPSAVTPVSNKNIKPNWTLRSGTTLKINLMEWCEKAGWKLAWHVKNTDYAITDSAIVSGTFYEAIGSVMTAYVDSSNPMAANIHEDNRVIEIVDHVPFQRNTITE